MAHFSENTARIISTVDPEARHGHKTTDHKFDGYKGRIVTDPDSEIITSTIVTPGNAGDARAAQDFIGDLLEDESSAGPRLLPDELKATTVLLYSLPYERQQRRCVRLEAVKIGHGRDTQVAGILSIDLGCCYWQ